MTIEKAIAILNKHEHRRVNTWHASGDAVVSDSCRGFLTDFEAIAVAEKYYRMEVQAALNLMDKEDRPLSIAEVEELLAYG